MDYSPEETLALQMFADDQTTFAIILRLAKKRLEKEQELVFKKTMLGGGTNEENGANLRAVGEGIRLVEVVFREISQYKTVQKPLDKQNPAI